MSLTQLWVVDTVEENFNLSISMDERFLTSLSDRECILWNMLSGLKITKWQLLNDNIKAEQTQIIFSKNLQQIILLYQQKIIILENQQQLTYMFQIYRLLDSGFNFKELSEITMNELAQGYSLLAPFKIPFLNLLIYQENTNVLRNVLKQFALKKIKIVSVNDCLGLSLMSLAGLSSHIQISQQLINFLATNPDLITVNRFFPLLSEQNNEVTNLINKNLYNFQQFLDSRLIQLSNQKYLSKQFFTKQFAALVTLQHDRKEYLDNDLIFNYKESDIKIEASISCLAIQGILHPKTRFLEELTNLNPQNQLFQSTAVKAVLSYKWLKYARKFFILRMLVITIMFTFVNLLAIQYFPNRIRSHLENNDQDYAYNQKMSLILQIIILIINKILIFEEVVQLFYYRKILLRYFNFLSIVRWMVSLIYSISKFIFKVYLFTEIAIILDCVNTFKKDTEHYFKLKILFSFQIFLIWIFFLNQLRGFKQTAFLIRMIIEVFRDMFSFLIIIIFLLLPASIAGYLLQPILLEMTFFRVILIFYYVILGDFDEFTDKLLDNSEGTTGIIIIFLIATILFMVVLLNLLIAIISDTYERVLSTYKQIFNYERLKIIFIIDQQLLGLQSFSWINFPFFQNLEKAYLMISVPKETDLSGSVEFVNENTRMRQKITDVGFKTYKIGEQFNELKQVVFEEIECLKMQAQQTDSKLKQLNKSKSELISYFEDFLKEYKIYKN